MRLERDKWNINDMDRWVYISLPDNTIDVDTKTVIKGWLPEVKVPARVLELPISEEREVTGGITYDQILSVGIRYSSDYESTYIRVKYKDLYYDVTEAREVNGRRRWLNLKCVYGGKEYNSV